jgi:hypothetical protein
MAIKTEIIFALLFAAATHAASPFSDKPCNSYAGEGLKWGSFAPKDFGSRELKFDTTGARTIHQVPAPGVHPRILFTPADLPEIRKNLKETKCGQAAWKNMLCWTEAMKGTYDDQLDYAKPDLWKGGFGGLHGRVPLFRLGLPNPEKGKSKYNKSVAASQLYENLSTGNATNCPDFYWSVFSLEAFRCLIEEDKSGAERLARGVVTALKIGQSERQPKKNKAGEIVPHDSPVGSYNLSFCYDFLFNYLTAEQKKLIHAELAETTWYHDNYGTFNEPTTSRSNWATFSYWLWHVLAIEDEPGFNDLKVIGMYKGWRNFLTYGWFLSGATFEGEAKCQLGMDGVIAFMMREKRYGFDNLGGHPNLLANARNFLPKSVIPSQKGFFMYDLLGGASGRPMPMDSLGLKHVYPNDPIIDWVYRSAMGEDYQHVPDRCDGYRNDLLFFLAYAHDFNETNTDISSHKVSQTFFCGERALLMTRSSWDKTAMMFAMHTRQANGGHAFADRNSIQVVGAGRVWSPPMYSSFATRENSVVCIDDKNQNLSTPGRMVDVVDEPLATFVVGDAKYCWDWDLRTLNGCSLQDIRTNGVAIPPGYQPELHTPNDFAYTKMPYAYLDRPLFELPSWIAPKGVYTPFVRKEAYPVVKAFRTAGLVRGAYPYALVVDDIQKDSTVHHYDWILTIQKDIEMVEGGKFNGRAAAQKGDILLASKEDIASGLTNGSPLLLVRVLEVKTDKPRESIVPRVEDIDHQDNPKKYGKVHRLVIPVDAVSPDFKVLIYPFVAGAPLPKTEWKKPGARVDISVADQCDSVVFAPAKSGKTNIGIMRDKKVILKIEKEIEPLKDALIEAEQAKRKAIRARLEKAAPLTGKVDIAVPAAFSGDKEGAALTQDLKLMVADGMTLLYWVTPARNEGALFTCNGNRGLSLSFEHGRALRIDTQGQHRWKGTIPYDFSAPQQIAVVIKGSLAQLYINGEKVREEEGGKPIEMGGKVLLGAGYTGTILFELYPRVLTAEEISDWYWRKKLP